VGVPFCLQMTGTYPMQFASASPTVSRARAKRNISVLSDELPRPEDLICAKGMKDVTGPEDHESAWNRIRCRVLRSARIRIVCKPRNCSVVCRHHGLAERNLTGKSRRFDD